MTFLNKTLAKAAALLSLREGTDREATIVAVRSDVELQSGGAWALVFAILIASVGLNVNSTAVIIGAMLISPLMGPIVGAGVALGTSDMTLLRRSVRNLLLATAIGLVASTLYFVLTPLADAQSELLARTRPTLFDVMIALFGGSAGIIAATRKGNRSQVVPGVAIATALMPPLCTAGFGLAHGDLWFFLGAMHLFLINALFICLATLGFIRLMGFERLRSEAEEVRRMRPVVILLTVAILVPSAWTGWQVVQESRFKGRARRFVSEQLRTAERSVINTEYRFGLDSSTIDATVLGERLDAAVIDSLASRLRLYDIPRTRLVLHQPLGKVRTADEIMALVRQSLPVVRPGGSAGADAESQARLRVLQAEVVRLRAAELPVRALTKELRALYPTLTALALGRGALASDTASGPPQSVGAIATWSRTPTLRDLAQVRALLALRLGTDSVQLANVTVR